MAAFLQFYQTSVSPLIRNGIPIIVVLGFWAALWRTGLTPKARIAGIATTAAMVIWWVTIDQLARFGFDASFWAVVRPLSFVFAISGVILMLRSRSIDGALHAAPAVATAPGSWGGQRPSPSEFPCRQWQGSGTR